MSNRWKYRQLILVDILYKGVTKLKIQSPSGRAGSIPAFGTIKPSRKIHESFYVETIYSENISRISSKSLVPLLTPADCLYNKRPYQFDMIIRLYDFNYMLKSYSYVYTLKGMSYMIL